MEADEPSFEFSTLKCQWSLTDSPTVTVHLKVAFCDEEGADDQARMALQVTAIVNMSFDDYVVYTGFVMGDKAADQSLNSGVQHDVDESTIVRIWLRDARAALVCSGDKPSADYEYHLRREDVDNDQLLTLAWKIKVRPFGLATLGTVQMRKVTSTMSVTCTSFITPLIRLLSAERKQQELSDLAAAECERRLSEDNRRLLNELRSMVDSRQLGDQRLMARFVKVLNAKKQRITDLQQKLDDLKLEHNVLQPLVAATSKQGKVAGRRRQGRGTCRSQPRSICKIRRSTISSQDIKWCPSSSEDENASLQCINGKIQQPNSMEVDGLNGVNISVNVVSDTEETLMSTSVPESSAPAFPIIPIPSSAEDIPIDPRYLADTQIDSPSSSPTWLQQSLTVSPSPQLQPPFNQHDKHELPKKKSVLDDLWSGIL